MGWLITNKTDKIIVASIIGLIIFGLIGKAVLADGGGSNQKASPGVTTTTKPETSTTTKGSRQTTTTAIKPTAKGFEQFSTVAFRVRRTTGAKSDTKCALNAVTPKAQALGLQGKEDLAGYDAMVFSFKKDVDYSFWGKDVPIAITVYWFDKDGKYVDQVNIDPCPADAAQCPRYATPSLYRYALEVPRRSTSDLRIADGSTVTFGGGCTA